MSKRNMILLGFVIVAAAQLVVPAWMIVGRELTLREGQVFKFKTRPVDPDDAFRGRYVWLGLEPESVRVPDTAQWQHGYYERKCYAVLGRDTNGFVMVKRLDRAWPAGETAVQVHTTWVDTNSMAHIQWPGLDRYYLMEDKAPEAEAAYHNHSLRTNQTCHVTVRVRGGQAVVENLFIADQPIHAWLREHQKK